MSFDTKTFLSSINCKYKIDEPLLKHTSLGIGGNASFFVEVDTEEKLISLLKFVNENKIKFFILGGGTNILFSDDGFEGIVIKLSQSDNFRGMDVWRYGGMETTTANGRASTETFGEDKHLSALSSQPSAVVNNSSAFQLFSCSASMSLPVFVRQTAEQGLSGLEHLAGIPGTIGGAIFGNAGVKEYSISDNLIKIEVVDFDGNKKILEKKDINFEYRKSGLKNCVITRAFFKLKKTAKNGILNTISQELEKRKNSQPLGTKNAGCVFKNPNNDSAGRLIDSLNLKNYSIGGIEISSKHANFFVNKNNGTAKDMLELIEFVKKKVYEKYNIELEPEIRIIK